MLDACDKPLQAVAALRRLEKRGATVRPSSLDADVIDMQARMALNVTRADEVVIPLDAVQQ
jgi:cell division protein FtsB